MDADFLLPVLIQAPMAGVSTPEMAAAVSNAGGLGSIAVGALSVEAAHRAILRTRALTSAPFNVNVFCHKAPAIDAERERRWLERLAPLFAEQGSAPPPALETLYKSFNDDAWMQSLLIELRPAVASFHFGLPPASVVRSLKNAGVILAGCATTLDEALCCEAAGMDMVIAQGAGAGGHRGVFAPERGDAPMETLALVQLLGAHCRVPVVAAGGIMDGAGMRAALDAGAAAVQLGTAFVLCPESAASSAHRRLLGARPVPDTRITSAISGRPARALVNRFVAEVAEVEVPAYPRAYAAGKRLAEAAAARGDEDFAVCWAGQGAALARAMPAALLVETLFEELEAHPSDRQGSTADV